MNPGALYCSWCWVGNGKHHNTQHKDTQHNNKSITAGILTLYVWCHLCWVPCLFLLCWLSCLLLLSWGSCLFYCYAECHCDVRHFAECRGTLRGIESCHGTQHIDQWKLLWTQLVKKYWLGKVRLFTWLGFSRLYFQMNASTFYHSMCRKRVGEHHNTQHDDTQHNNKTWHNILGLDV